MPLWIGLAVMTLAASTASAQPVAPPDAVEALSAALHADQRAHLWRVGAWGLANAVGGTALVLASDRETQPGRWAFGVQSGAWGAVNVGIAVFGLMNPGDAVGDWAAAVADENGYADVLLVNLGLNAGYMAVGGTLVAVAGRGVSTPDAWRGHGTALILQGAGLMVLDVVAYLGTRDRMNALIDLAGGATVTASATGLRLTVGL